MTGKIAAFAVIGVVVIGGILSKLMRK